MKYGIIADIHSNYNALETVWSFLKEQQIDEIINCGDVVGYGPQPNECIELMNKTKNVHSVMGNHDRVVVKSEEDWRFNPVALKAAEWTKKQLKSSSIKYLASLDCNGEAGNFMFVHGSPCSPLNEYIIGVSEAVPNFKKITKTVCFIGHTHTAACFKCDIDGNVEAVKFNPGSHLELKEDSQYIINVGSVGQPRDGDPRSSVCIFDANKLHISLYRIKYDVNYTQSRILKAGLPDFLAYRLEQGI